MIDFATGLIKPKLLAQRTVRIPLRKALPLLLTIALVPAAAAQDANSSALADPTVQTIPGATPQTAPETTPVLTPRDTASRDPAKPTADPARTLTLAEAQQIALASNPDLQSVQRSIGIAQAGLRRARADYFPQINGALTAAGAEATGYGDDRAGGNTLTPRITAGGLNEPSVEDRAAAGVSVSQLLFDFGRTNNLVDSAKANLSSATDQLEDQRQLLLLAVTAQYMQALEAQGTLKVAQKTLSDRSTFLDRVSLLQKNKLKSELDVSFAAVDVDQARLLTVQTQADVESSLAALESTIGKSDFGASDSDTAADNASGIDITLVDPQAVLPPPPAGLGPLLRSAFAHRPELQRLRDELTSAQKYASAQHKLQAPTISAIGAAGVTPIGDANLPQDYAAGGINLSVPIFQGGRLQAEYDEARLKAEQADDAVRSAELALTRDVRSAWLSAQADYQAITVSDHLQSSAQSALELAQSRYRLGVSSIVELNRAELNSVDAAIGDVRARYEYRIALARLAYRSGTLSSCSQAQDACR